MKIRLLFALTFASVLVVACASAQPPPPSPPPDPSALNAPTIKVLGDDAGDDDAARACANLKALECPEWNPFGAGLAKCAQVVRENANDTGSGIHPDCIIRARTKQEVWLCHVRCGKA